MKSPLLVLGLVSLTACRHAPAPAPPPKGEAAFQIVAPPPQASKDISKIENFAIPPEPIEPLATPIYPKAALASPKGAVTVGLRVNIDSKGVVTGTQTSLAVFSSPNSYEGGFREAVEAAVMQWRFEPARIKHVTRVKDKDGKDALMLRDDGAVDWSIDVAFTFTASGDVLAGVPIQGQRAKDGN